jgi:hypothetical protein
MEREKYLAFVSFYDKESFGKEEFSTSQKDAAKLLRREYSQYGNVYCRIFVLGNNGERGYAISSASKSGETIKTFITNPLTKPVSLIYNKE